jgi:hypothetical protein
MHFRYFIAAMFILMLMLFSGCSSSVSDEAGDASDVYPAGNEADADYLSAISNQGYEVIDSVTTGTDTGYLAVNPDGKKLIMLKGSSFNMGYQFGKLLPEATYKMTAEYPYNMVASFMGFSKEQAPALYDLLFKTANALCEGAVNDNSIPAYLVEEMRGMAAGANDGGYAVKYEDILMVNEGIDALYSIVLTGAIPALKEADKILKAGQSSGLVKYSGNKVLFPTANLNAFGCNGFVVSGDATVGGKVYHGRDFMFPTGEHFHKEAVMAVYIPDAGLPFVTLAAPGFVGLTTGLNAQGVSMGVDVVFGGATRATPGTGCLLVVRDIIQNSASLDDAVVRMKKLNRGVSWLYVIADKDRSENYTNGIVCEVGMKKDINGNEFVDGSDLLPDLSKLYYSKLIKELDKLEKADEGVMVRDQNWKYPDEFKGKDNFNEQIEELNDLVVASNHYIIPNMVFTTLSPWMRLVAGAEIKTSVTVERYEDLNSQLLDAYGSIDYETARDLIDFMNPNRGGLWKDYYKINGEIEGHHDLFDNANLTMECLYGFYNLNEPWAFVDLKPFIR